jgi:TolB-like protein
VLISSTAHDHVRGKIEADFLDLGEKALKNIARPVRVYAIKIGSEGSVPAETVSIPRERGPPRLSIVVLPFANIGGDPEQEYFADGVTESLTTDLSRISGSFVIARNTAFTYKGKPVDVKKVGTELNVRHVLEGSVQRASSRIRLNIQLIDAETGSHSWADRFDKPVTDFFDMQDEIIARLSNVLSAQLVSAEARRAEKSPSPDSMDCYFLGMAHFNRGVAPEPLVQARRHFERAVILDPKNLDALVGMAQVDTILAGGAMAEDGPARLRAAEEALTTALAIVPGHASAHHFLGAVYAFTNRSAQCISECERALALDRNLAWAHSTISIAKITLGRFEEVKRHIQDAIKLSPIDPTLYIWLTNAAVACFALGDDEEAVGWCRRSIEINRNYNLARFYLSAALVHSGRVDEARSEVAAGLAMQPNLSISRLRAAAMSDNPNYLSLRERLYDGLRRAGVPEQ